MARAEATERCSCGATVEMRLTGATADLELGRRLEQFRLAHASCSSRWGTTPASIDKDVKDPNGQT